MANIQTSNSLTIYLHGDGVTYSAVIDFSNAMKLDPSSPKTPVPTSIVSATLGSGTDASSMSLTSKHTALINFRKDRAAPVADDSVVIKLGF